MNQSATPTSQALGQAQTETDRIRIDGVATVVFCFDMAFAIDLEKAAVRLASSKSGTTPEREQLMPRRGSPRSVNFDPPPLRVALACESVDLAGCRSDASAEVTLYDFGGASVAFRVPFMLPLEDLPALGAAIADAPAFLSMAAALLRSVSDQLGDALARPGLQGQVEDYATFHVRSVSGAADRPTALLERHAHTFARTLRAEAGPLSTQEVADALSRRLSYSDDDLVVLDYASALVFDTDVADLLEIIEFANVELVEMRHLDEALDDALETAYAAVAGRPRRPSASEARRVATLQIDAAMLFEGVNNAIKLVGDYYLARLYQSLAERLHHADWDASVLRKLATLEGIYRKITDDRSTRRMEVLEWIIIILIAVSIVLPFLPFFGGK